MKKLWQKENSAVTEQVEKFTVGRDLEFDILLAPYDVQGSIAHVTMLGEVGLMAPQDATIAVNALQQIAQEIAEGKLALQPGVEDIHSQVELLLTERIGDIGKMIHSGRSRNDQVAVDIKLFLRNACVEMKDAVVDFFNLLQKVSEANKDILIPGYTHLQVAMPSSAGMWLGAYAESLIDDVNLLATAYELSNKNPLGSGAGYGSSFPLNRNRTTELLGFQTLHWNSVYAQMGRGKTEKFVAMAIASIAATLARLAMDGCLYLSQNFNFISFPETLTTGSSIMPHKKNPDVFELVRGKCNRLQALPNEINMMLTNLPNGYHRELQLTKEILFPAIQELMGCLSMMQLMFENISFRKDIVAEEKYKYMFSVEAVNDLVNQGVPFRDAYKQVGDAINNGAFSYDSTELHHTHEGSIGNLCTQEIKNEMDKIIKKFV